VFVAIGALVAVASRPDATSTYFEQPSSAGVSGTGKPGERLYAGLAQLEVRTGDSVELLAVDRLPTGTTTFVVRLRETDAALGVAHETFIDDPSAFRPLAGGTFGAVDGPLQVIALITANDRDILVSGPVLRFSVNGRPAEAERLLISVLICALGAHPEGPCGPPNPPKM
jgi:hypothetical protein